MTTEKNTAPVREPYDAMGPVDAPNPPAARATLADVQPGGRVRLGDAPFVWSDRTKADALEAGQYAFTEADGKDLGYTACIEACVDAICGVLALPEHRAALSAHPSPGGQGDARAQFEAWAKKRRLSLIRDQHYSERQYYAYNDVELAFEAWQAALAARHPAQQPDSVALGEATEFCIEKGARQPVGEPVEKTDGEVAAQFFADHPALALRYWHEHIRRPLTHVPATREESPHFECTSEQWERHTTGMTDGGKKRLANMLAHHCLLARRDDRGWIITRFHLIRSGKPWWHVSNDGVLTYDYDPATKARMVAAQPAQAVDLGQFIALAKFGEEFAFSAERQPHSRVIYSQASRLLALIDSQAVGNG